MAFDQPTRNRLARFVGEARSLLTEEFTRQLQHEYGLDPARGEVAELAKLTQLDDARRETARILRDTLAHYLAGQAAPPAKVRQEALERIVREQAFTVLNRLCALRMAEARGIVIESIAKGYQSRGFQLYARLAGTALGETGEAYRTYLFSLFDEFGVDLAVLFDRFSPQGRLFPRPSTLLQLLAAINHADLEPLWAEDETIGWIYQYFNSKEERKAMRDASQAPRNSRELAVRNQFFTPRYVVEFLTDNTLGRIWYEMCKGQTRLKEQCRYLVRRPVEIFLDDPDQYLPDECRPWVRRVRSGDFTELPDDPTELELASISFAFNGYTVAEKLGRADLLAWAREQLERYTSGGPLPTSALDLWFLLFALQREWRIINGSGPAGEEFLTLWRQLYKEWKSAIQDNGSDLAQQELLQQPVYIAHRPPKDPNTILMLDPACGSMHFGLYAFDLFETIYQEAWEKGWVPATDFPYGDKRTIDHATIQLDPQRIPISNYSGEPAPFEDAYVVMTSQGDGGDGVLADTPYLVASTTKFRVPFSSRVKLGEFDYQQALQDGTLDEATGEQFVRAVGCFAYTELPSRHSPEAYAAFQRLTPRLIMEHNIHGIDIDPRAVQIAGLSLWLRAQKRWQAQGLKPHERPPIRKSNIVCAEPMPGDKALLEEFLQGLRDDRLEALIRRVLNVPENQRVRATPTMADALCDLVRTVWEEMKLAGEAGSLLKIEEALTDAIAKGRAEWEEKMPLFRVETFRMTEEKPKVNYVKVVPGEGVDFWERSEVLVLAALEEYTEQIGDDSYQRRLFAEDAARGFAFIDLCRKRYDIILMNPPFGQPTSSSQKILATYPKNTPANLYTVFIVRAAGLITSYGTWGMISDSTFLKQPTFLPTREFLLSRIAPLHIVVDLGWEVLDANVRTAISVVLRPGTGYLRTFDTSNSIDRGNLLLGAVENHKFTLKQHHELLALPKSVFALDLATGAGRKLIDMQALGSLCSLPWGCGANDSFRLFRLRWEVAPTDINVYWAFLTNGGSFSPFYRENFLTCRSKMENGESAFMMEFRNGTDRLYDASAQELYFSLGLTYPKRSEFFHVALLPRGHVFTPEGKGLFLKENKHIWFYIGLLNSTFVASIADIMCGPHKQRGDVELIKVPSFDAVDIEKISKEARLIFTLCRQLMFGEELSTTFLHPLANVSSLASMQSLNEISNAHQVSISKSRDNVLLAMERIDKLVESVVPDELRGFCKHVSLLEERSKLWNDIDDCTESILSYALGCIFGRWDIQFANGAKHTGEIYDPFAPLPICSPGMLQNDHRLPATIKDLPIDYPLYISWHGVLVDDPGHSKDIEQHVRDVFSVIWLDHSDAIEQEACEILGVSSLRAYFTNPNSFFDDHLKRYSKSRRVAPIYWPLATPSGSYTLWLYYHRLTDQTLYSCVNDFVDPKLAQVNEDVDTLRRRTNRSRQEEKDLERLSDLALELDAFRTELLRIARFWQPNLNDGVQITAAPLWRLFQHRAWQKRLKETWAALEAGDYDWAHLAYSIWPDRVRAKCKTDKSLAIAHDLEPLYVEPVKPVKAKKGGRKPQVDEDEQGELL